MSSFEKVDTKKEAFRLVHDPTRLLYLLYSKYGDIEEDFYILNANQLVYNKSTHLNIIFRELQVNNNNDEFLKRLYRKSEIRERIPKLSEYYKNYSKFFCVPIFTDRFIYKLMHRYEEKKAEDFYVNNYENEESKNKKENKSRSNEYNSESSLSSLDNITNNKTIFDERNRKIIDNDLNFKNYSMTLSMDSINKKSNYTKFLSKRSKGKSFEEIVKNIVDYKFKRKKTKKKQKFENKINKKNNNLALILNMNKSRYKNKSYIFFSDKITKHFFSKVSSRFEEYNKNRIIKVQGNHRKNKTTNIQNHNSYNILNNNVISIKNSNFKNFTKLNKILKRKKVNTSNNTNCNSNDNSNNNTIRENNYLINKSNLIKKVISFNNNTKKKKNKTFDNNLILNKNHFNKNINIYKKSHKLINPINLYVIKSSYYGSNFNLVKSPKYAVFYSNDQTQNNNYIKTNKYKDRKSLISNNSSIIPKKKLISPKGEVKILSDNRIKNKPIKGRTKNNFSYTNNNYNINFNNVIFYNQRSTNILDNVNYNSVKNIQINPTLKNSKIKINENCYIKNLKKIYNISRNKIKMEKNSLTQNHSGNNKTNSKTKSKNSNNTVYDKKKSINKKYKNKFKNDIKLNKNVIKFGGLNNKILTNNFFSYKNKKININTNIGHKRNNSKNIQTNIKRGNSFQNNNNDFLKNHK